MATVDEVGRYLAQHAQKQQALAAEWAKARSLLMVCAEAGLSAKAAKKYVHSGMTVEKLRAMLAEKQANV